MGHETELEEMEQVEAGRVERILAAGMVLFMLIGGVWVLNRISRLVPFPDRTAIELKHGLTTQNEAINTLSIQAGEAERLYAEKAGQVAKSQAEYEFRREEYRMLVEQGRSGDAEKAVYERARADYEAAVGERDIAASVRDRTRDELLRRQKEISDRQDLASKEYEAALRAREVKLFLLRCLYVLPLFGFSFLAWQRLRRGRNRYLVIATALLAFATIQAVVVALQYSWRLLRGFAQLAVSVVGTIMCGLALVALRRYVVNPERIAVRRMRRGQCPHCGFPRPSGSYCASCGGALTRACPSCGGTRPVNAPYCPACGKAQ